MLEGDLYSLELFTDVVQKMGAQKGFKMSVL